MEKDTLCWRCTRPGTGSCSWDKRLVPVDGWTAVPSEFREQDGSYAKSWRVLLCPQFQEEPDYDHRMSHVCIGRPTLVNRNRIFHLVHYGWRNEAIALEFGIAVETVKKYRTEWNKLREAER